MKKTQDKVYYIKPANDFGYFIWFKKGITGYARDAHKVRLLVGRKEE